MGISKITNLFAANTDAVPAVTPTKGVTSQSNQTRSAPQGGSDAVVFSSRLQPTNRAAIGDAETARSNRVQQLKEQITNGAYKVDREKVAVSILRDLA